MNTPIQLLKLRGDLRVFSSDTCTFMKRYYKDTQLKTSLIFPLMLDRRECKEGLDPIQNAYLIHVDKRIKNPGDAAHNHVEDVLFAIKTVRENRYEHGVQSTIADIDDLIAAIPNYSSLEDKEELVRSLTEAKEKLRKRDF